MKSTTVCSDVNRYKTLKIRLLAIVPAEHQHTIILSVLLNIVYRHIVLAWCFLEEAC